jgi:hypothetical protein
MESEQKANFLELGHREVSAKFSHLAKNNTEIKVWHKGETPVLCRVVEYKFEERIQIQLMSDSLAEDWLGTEALLTFDYNNVHYFSNCTVTADNANGGNWLVVGDSIYKSEKRQNERLLAYPHFQFYAYFRVSDTDDTSNVISLNKHKEPNAKVFKQFNRMRSEELLDLEGEGPDELAGFRIMDVSGNGLSFLSNEKEMDYFEHCQADKDNRLNFILLLGEKTFSIEQGRVVYIVDYVNPRADKVATYKIGFTFNANTDLAANVESLLLNSNSLGENEKEFEGLVE